MNQIDKICERIASKWAKKGKIARANLWNRFRMDERTECRNAIGKYQQRVSPEVFELELLASRYWGSGLDVATANYTMRAVVLRLADKLNEGRKTP